MHGHFCKVARKMWLNQLLGTAAEVVRLHHRIIEVERNLWRSSNPHPPLLKAGFIQYIEPESRG